MSKGTLIGVKAKLKWADVHLDHLKAKFSVSTKEPKNALIVQRDPDGLHTSINTEQPLLEFALMAGNVAHQIRSSLDHVVFQLALQHPRKVAKYIAANGSQGRRKLSRVLHYPIYESENDFSANWKVNALRAVLSKREFAAIKRTQPYERNKHAPKSEYLFILNALDNIDKHRTLLVIDQRASVRATIDTGVERVLFQTPASIVKSGAKLFSIRGLQDTPQFKMRVDNVTMYITFSDTDGLCDDTPVIEMLRSIRRHVEKIIDRDFARFFA
jgi:hypothetical protein